MFVRNPWLRYKNYDNDSWDLWSSPLSYPSIIRGGKDPWVRKLRDNEFSTDGIMVFRWFIIGSHLRYYRARYIRITLLFFFLFCFPIKLYRFNVEFKCICNIWLYVQNVLFKSIYLNIWQEIDDTLRDISNKNWRDIPFHREYMKIKFLSANRIIFFLFFIKETINYSWRKNYFNYFLWINLGKTSLISNYSVFLYYPIICPSIILKYNIWIH